MGWSHPDISLPDLLKLIKGFVDILILATGYQSSGNLAHWDAQNVKKAFQWGLFFEKILMCLSQSDEYQDSVKELDVALSNMTSNPYFPQGLAHLSSATLCRARDLVLKQLIHALPLRDQHLRASILATIEMDLDDLQMTENNYFPVYLEKLMLDNSLLDPDVRSFIEDSRISSADFPKEKRDYCTGDLTKFNIQELRRRQYAVSCISSAEALMDALLNVLTQSNWIESHNSIYKEQSRHATTSQLVLAIALRIEEQLLESVTWKHWRARNLSYFLDKRTIRLVSGARMIFSAPKIQWVKVLNSLSNSEENNDQDLHEIIELLLLGYMAGRWNSLIEHFMLVSNDFLTTSKQHHEVFNLLQGRYHNCHSKGEMISLKEKDIIEYLETLLGGQLHQLWRLSPALAAAAIPSWSGLFRLYLSELGCHFNGGSPTLRCCSCGKEHKDCEVAERVWCLHVFHARGAPIKPV